MMNGNKDSEIFLAIYNITGQKLRTLINDQMKSGMYTTMWDGTDDNGAAVSSGVCCYIMKIGNDIQMKKMLLLK